MRNHNFILGTLIILATIGNASAAITMLVPNGSTWKYRIGLAEASTPPDSWRSNLFNDATWATGPAPIGYDTGGTPGVPAINTVTPTSTVSNYTTIYLRKSFSVANPANIASLELTVQVDDGYVAWLNGVEIGRVNVPLGDLAFDAAASVAEETRTDIVTLTNLLVAGDNLLAIHALNANTASSDLVIEAQLTATVDDVAPTLLSITPPAGSIVQSLSSIEVLFSEPVQGVNASDLLINNVPANDLIFGIPGQFVFGFPTAPTGVVTVVFANNHGITDLAPTPNAFVTPGSWTYTVNPNLIPSRFIINEFMAANTKTLNDEYGEQSDWIEIYNPGSNPGNLAGWFLTDETNNLTKWRFPARNMDPGAYLVVFASGRNQTNLTGNLHTSFQLNSIGDYLALVDPETNVVSAFSPTYPPQSDDVSYGRDRLNPNINGFFSTPTPGAANSSSGSGFVPEVHFSHNSRAFPTNQPFALTLTTALPGAAIFYSLGTNFPGSNSPASFRYTNPITISNTLAIHARAFASGLLPSAPVSKTYIGLANQTNVLNFSSDLPIMILHNYGQGVVPANSDVEQYVFVQTFESDYERSSMTNPPTLSARGIFHARGSSTLGYAKTSFFLETRDEFGANLNVPLLGLPPESDWVLYAPNNFEPALMHNPLAMQLTRDGGEYAPRTRFVEVFLKDDAGAPGPVSSTGFGSANGDYQGIYVLMEKIKRDKNRVDIEKLEPEHIAQPEVTGGYLVSIDRSDTGTVPVNAGGATLNWLEPNYRTMTNVNRVPQRNYFISYFNAFNAGLTGANLTNAVNNTNHHSYYINIDSWVRRHVHETLTFNVDALRLSGYLYKDRSKKIEYGPAWDYDRTQGSTDGRDINPRVWANSGGTDFFNFSPWWGTLFRAPDFWQAWIDRYQQERRPGGSLTTNNIFARVDEFYEQLKEAQPRELARWNVVGRGANGTGAGTYVTELQWKRNWYASRLEFMDTNFLASPSMSSTGGMVAAGFQVTLSPAAKANSSVIYTLDGTDPRLPNGFISPTALSNNSLAIVTVNSNMRIVARSWNPTHRNLTGSLNPPISSSWSSPIAATYYTTVPPLRITEIMYHPANPPTGNTNDQDNYEYLEFRNISGAPLSLAGFRLRGGVEFNFSSFQLGAGSNCLVVRHLAAFQSRYGTSLPVVGVYTNNLANDGDHVVLEGSFREPILSFDYQDGWYPITDGSGFSLQIVNDNAATDTWGLKSSWRPSGSSLGTPGTNDTTVVSVASILVNEALTHTDPPLVDAIELSNTNATNVSIGGWFLTDDFGIPKKYRIPNGTQVPANGYLVIYENNSFGATFSLSSLGDAVYLYSADPVTTNLTGWVHGFDFGAQANGDTFGRYVISTGNDHFPTSLTPTLGFANSLPRVGPVIISEINYHPPERQGLSMLQDNNIDEFIELFNLGPTNVPLYDPNFLTNTWKFRDAVDYTFPNGTVITNGEYILVTQIDPADPAAAAAFRSRNGVSPGVRLFGPFSGQLDNSADRVELTRPDRPEMPPAPNAGFVPYILVERISYQDVAPWAAGADGIGPSLQRLTAGAYGNDPANWAAAGKTPGGPYVSGAGPTITQQPVNTVAIQSVSAALSLTASGPGPITYQWRKSGSVLPGKTNSILNFPSVQTTDAGVYDCVVLNPSGAVVSSNATLTVLISANIDIHPVTTMVRVRPDPLAAPTTNATFTVAASSSTPIRYQWRYNGTNIAGQTNASLTITNVQVKDDGLYGAAITDNVGTVFTTNAPLYALITPIIVPGLISYSAVTGAPVTLSIAMIGGNPLPYTVEWRRGSTPLATNVVNESEDFITVLAPSPPTANVLYRILVRSLATTGQGIIATNLITSYLDSDGDGIPDPFDANPGLNDATLDTDEDGMNNYAEYVAGTDPNDKFSYLKIDRITATGGAQLEFFAVSNRTYSVVYKDGLTIPAWSNLSDIAVRLTNRVERVIDPGPGTNRIYRLVVPAQP